MITFKEIEERIERGDTPEIARQKKIEKLIWVKEKIENESNS